MFVDELLISAKAGNGGDGVVRWLREHARPKGGPAGGDGGRGGDVYVRAVEDKAILARYRGEKEFKAENGEAGRSKSQHGKDGENCTIDVPVGSSITDLDRNVRYELPKVGMTEKILKGGHGGLGNEYFKSSTNRVPFESTKGKVGEEGRFFIELELSADAGLIGLPNAGKSSLLNALTSAASKVGSYPFTTLEPHLGSLYGYILADIPGLIEGAAEGKGLGHKFLRHIKKTRMLLHCIAADTAHPLKTYEEVRKEIKKFDPLILEKPEWIIITKADLIPEEDQKALIKKLEKKQHVEIVSILDDALVKKLKDKLVQELRKDQK